MIVSALFVRPDSHYKSIPGVDAYDYERDALTWPGGTPAIYHPPCRSWAKLKAFAKPRPGERELALWSVRMCRAYGGVIEHPKDSDLWKESGCRTPGVRDQFGGVLITLNQADYGHRAQKATSLYIVRAPIPSTPYDLVQPSHLVQRMGRAERERTPLPFAHFLVQLARSVQ